MLLCPLTSSFQRPGEVDTDHGSADQKGKTCFFTIAYPWQLRQQRIRLQCGRPGFDPWVGGSPGGKHGNPLHYSCPENPHARGAWRSTPRGRKESDMTEQLNTGQRTI